MMVNYHILGSVWVALIFFTSACSNQPTYRDPSRQLILTEKVDIDRYLGRWYEIARLPNRFEKNCEGVTADYIRRDNGIISVINTCRKNSPDGEKQVAKGRARIVDPETNAKLRVSFFGPFWGDYWILDLDDNYSLAIVGEPSGKYLWILSRTPIISTENKEIALKKLHNFGYDTNALYFTQQPPADG